MKKIICFLALAATAAFTSCSNDDDSGNNSGNEVTAIDLTSSTESIVLGEGSFTFTVKDQNGNTVTDATLTANQTAITSPWTPEAIGTYTIKATYGQLTDELTVTVNEQGNTVTAINLTASAESVEAGTAVTFTVTDQDNAVVTGATLTANDTPITSPWTPEISGEYVIVATLGELTVAINVTVTDAPQTENIFTVNGTEYQTTNNVLIYFGTDAGVNYWVLASYSSTGEGEEAEVINESDIIFTSLQTNETTLDFPTPQTITFGEQNPGTKDASIIFDTTNELEITDEISSLNLTINSITLAETVEEQFINYNYSLELNNGTTVEGTFNGNWGFLNASQTAGRNSNSSKQVIKVSKSQILQRIKSKTYLK
ncbi:hypothetical protein FUA48_00930 [Flavobacterium alkalisoli]|uniref:Dystroglycan-type cadherin-like domain-containing protein n=1 Tax=Flavobacterium alkalisoli TaxID=2602769 RepID=A0A5B9FPD4_9FLAO|nr:hypothetical protein [Flavobacterium alkalisoli]QEE48189.1 hypothetical protein FUA48_00930 [Flavobacterium alkalisoli]